jgi:DNA (cytosine-5)-methyltransferase 1
MANYYNEFDPNAAEWMRELIKAGLIPDGDVDERDIRDILPEELAGYTQCHFFAGIGGWSQALRLAGWPEDRPVWTGSCPCQPFSAAGRGIGFADERHLWPHWHHLINQCQPPIVFGEQVASKDGLGWLDLVQADLEGSGYATGATDLCAAGIGAPHIRQRLWWVGTRLANANGNGSLDGINNAKGWRAKAASKYSSNYGLANDTSDGSVANADNAGSQGWVSGRSDQGWQDQLGHSGRSSAVDGLGNATGRGQWSGIADHGRDGGDKGAHRAAGDVGGLADTNDAISSGQLGLYAQDGSSMWQGDSGSQSGSARGMERPCPTNGFWRDADWLFCRDGKWRPVEPGTFALAHGVPGRVGRLRVTAMQSVRQRPKSSSRRSKKV